MPAFTAAVGAAIGGLTSATAIGVGGLALSAAGMYMNYQGAQEQKKAGALEREAEKVRQQQMNLDAMRRKRELIRQSQVAAAQSTAIAGAQGAGESSGLQGALGGISGQSGVNILGVSQNQEVGNKIFDINSRKSQVMSNASFMSSTGAGLSSLGGALVKNEGIIGKLGTYMASGLRS
jgi:hypothetical protein